MLSADDQTQFTSKDTRAGTAVIATDDSIAFGKHFKLYATSLEVVGDPTFAEWQNACKQLQFIHRSIHWWLGDLLRFGEAKFGEKYAQALDETPFAYQTLRNDVWVATAIELSRRKDALSFSHHSVVAALPPAEQDKWLDIAEREGWSSRKLWAESRNVPEKLVPLYGGVGTLSHLHGPHGQVWKVELPPGAKLEAKAGDQVHIIIKEGL